MKISHGQIDGLLKAYAQQVQRAKAGPAGGAPEAQTLGVDKLTLSDRMREIQMVRDVLARTPDIRVERVQEIARAIADGTYSVRSEEVAEKMLARALADRIGE